MAAVLQLGELLGDMGEDVEDWERRPDRETAGRPSWHSTAVALDVVKQFAEPIAAVLTALAAQSARVAGSGTIEASPELPTDALPLPEDTEVNQTNQSAEEVFGNSRTTRPNNFDWKGSLNEVIAAASEHGDALLIGYYGGVKKLRSDGLNWAKQRRYKVRNPEATNTEPIERRNWIAGRLFVREIENLEAS